MNILLLPYYFSKCHIFSLLITVKHFANVCRKALHNRKELP